MIRRILEGHSDANIAFGDLCNLFFATWDSMNGPRAVTTSFAAMMSKNVSTCRTTAQRPSRTKSNKFDG